MTYYTHVSTADGLRGMMILSDSVEDAVTEALAWKKENKIKATDIMKAEVITRKTGKVKATLTFCEPDTVVLG